VDVLLLLALMVLIAVYVPAIDMMGEPCFNVDVFWLAVLIGLLTTVPALAARAFWRRSMGRSRRWK
jgi:hypothetical protein